MKEYFNFLGCLISGSGFEDIVHQAGLCSPGSLNRVISGSHYNRCWAVHASFAEASARLLFQIFLKTDSEIESTVDDDLQNRDQSKQALRDRQYGKTSQFWGVTILMSIEMFICFIVLFKKTIFFLRLFGRKQLVLLTFALNKTCTLWVISCQLSL